MKDIRRVLLKEGYLEGPSARILSRSDFQSINYSDGVEEETNLLNVLKGTRDVSVLSHELMMQCVDWVTSYHFSWTRANLLRPFEETLRGSQVIEIGAGCGGITRYLGEVAKDVVAVEGSIRRCEINAERVRDLDNVQIVASELSEFETKLKFDVVVVVGVLEYSGLFIEGETPHLDFLRKARKLLKPRGKMLLAIENKLGLKYFAGAKEDHLGIPMVGIENQYAEKGVRTFSRIELTNLVSASGFSNTWVHAPIPDYKIVRAVVTEEGMLAEDFDSHQIFSQLSNSDPQLTSRLNFKLPKAWKSIGEAKLENEFTNSFLVECSASQEATSSLRSQMAYWYGDDRKPQYLLQKIFYKTQKLIQVESRSLSLNPQCKNGSVFEQDITPNSRYFGGISYIEKFNQFFDWQNWELSTLQEEISKFLKLCEEWAIGNSYSWQIGSSKPGIVDRRLVDLIPRNVKISPTGSFEVFDLEWISKQNIQYGFLAFRVAMDLLGSTRTRNPYAMMHTGTTLRQILDEVLAPFCQGAETVESYIKTEYELFNLVLTKNLTWHEYSELFDAPFLSREPKDRIETELDSIRVENEAISNSLRAMEESLSWKLTEPLRRIIRKIRR